MQYLQNTKIPCLTYHELVPHIMGKPNYDQSKQRGRFKVSCTGGNGREILIEYPSLPKKYQELVVNKYGDPHQYIALQPLKDLCKVDGHARQFYAEYKLPTTGKELPLNYQLMYARQCDWLNVIKLALKDKTTLKDTLNISIDQFWQTISRLINEDKEEPAHELPGSVDRLQRKYKKYRDGGYASIVDASRFGNDFARKVDGKIENLIVSLYCMPHKPYMSEVCKLYREFMSGKLQVVDVHPQSGGEVFRPEDFYVKGNAYTLGESTVDYYLKKEGNEAVINQFRMNKLAFNTAHRPSVRRLAPFYAFSKITMDDLDIPFKTPEGDRAVKSYQIFDVASGAVIGASFSRDKNIELIREALRDMFRLIIRNGWGVPFEIEFERHLTSAMTGGVEADGTLYNDVLTAGAVFPTTRMCLGGNAKEKRAEGFIRVKKYQQQKQRPGFQARFYARLLTNRLNAEQDKVRYQYNEIVQNELNDIAAHNNELHPKQDLYPGMTRWDVLTENQNPMLPKYQPHTVMQYIGYRTETSIRAGFAQVQYNHYQLPDINLIKETKYNGKIEAYYLPDTDGNINSVYLFENGQFLCEASKVARFQEAIIEQTEQDKNNATGQWGYQKQFDKMAKDGRSQLIKVATTRTEAKKELPEPVIVGVEQGKSTPNTLKTPGKSLKKGAKSTQNSEYNGGCYPENSDKISVEQRLLMAQSRANSGF